MSHTTTRPAMSVVLPGFSVLITRLHPLLAETSTPPLNRIAAELAQWLGTIPALPSALMQPAADGYRRQVLYEGADGRFSIGGFTWGAGQRTPIHDHAAWGVIGVARGSLSSETFTLGDGGRLRPAGHARLDQGATAWVDPSEGDIHRIGAATAETSVSIHIYGCDFATVCRNRYEDEDL